MTTVAIVDGVKVQMFANDHPPPRLHFKYGEFEAMLSIATGDVLEGSLPRPKLRAIRNWFSPRQEQLAFGETPNLATRLQGIAAPNTLVISAATLQLLGGFFACQPLGTPLLKGLNPAASGLSGTV